MHFTEKQIDDLVHHLGVAANRYDENSIANPASAEIFRQQAIQARELAQLFKDYEEETETIQQRAKRLTEQEVRGQLVGVPGQWAVSRWLGEKLAAKGERVDFAELVLWQRQRYQLVYTDRIIEEIAKDLRWSQRPTDCSSPSKDHSQ